MITVDELIELEILVAEELERVQEDSESSEAEREAISPDVAIGRLSRLDSMQMQEIAKEAERQREDRVVFLEMAQERIDQGTYGICESCKGEIPYERLKITPEASRCGKCAI